MRGYGIGVSYPEQTYKKRAVLITPINLALGKSTTIKISTFQMDRILVSVTQGTLDLWFGDYTGNIPLVPHLHFYATGEPKELWIPGLGKNINTVTVAGNGAVNPCLGCIILMGENE